MRCKSCGYALLNLPEKRCPECGQAFALTDFWFVREAVHFQCPHCTKRFRGNDEQGLPAVREFDCPGCGQHVHVNDLHVIPLVDDPDAITTRPGCPWERAEPDFFRTLGRAMVAPGRLFREVRFTGHRARAWSFALLVAWAAALGPFVLWCVLLAQQRSGWSLMAPMAGRLIFVIVRTPVVATIVLWCFAAAAHGLVMLTGRRHGYWATVKAVSYGSAPMVLGIIPYAGAAVGAVWSLVAITVGLRYMQERSTGVAVCAALAGVLASLVVGAGLLILAPGLLL